MLQEGLLIGAAGTTIDLQCGSAQQAINFGAAQIASGVFDVVIASASSTWVTSHSRTSTPSMPSMGTGLHPSYSSAIKSLARGSARRCR